MLLSNNSDDGCWLRIFVFSRQNISCAKDNCFSSSSSTSTSSSIFIFHFLGKLEVCLKKKEKQRKYEIITYKFYCTTDLGYTSHQREISIWLLCLVTYVSMCNILKHFIERRIIFITIMDCIARHISYRAIILLI